MLEVRVTVFLTFVIFQRSCAFVECCENGYALDDELKCTRLKTENTTVFEDLHVRNESSIVNDTCFEGDGGGNLPCSKKEENQTDSDTRQAASANGTMVLHKCSENSTNTTICRCESIFTPLKFWGASIVLFANMIYVIPYLTVVIFYCAIPDLRNRAYDKAVLCYNAGQLLTAIALLGIGYFVICHKYVNPVFFIPLGLTFQFLTISSVAWLSLICFDMTLVITRFRWMPSSNEKERDERRKFRIYSAVAWGVALVPTVFALVMELCPWIPESSPLKPNFMRFYDGANFTVIFYVMTLPVLLLIFNNVLFVYTTYKVVKIRKSTAIAHQNTNKSVRKKYFMFLRLYLLMDAPWIVGVMASVYPDLWVLKFCRMLQPILMLMAILPKKKFLQAVGCSEKPTPRATRNTRNKSGFVTYV